MSALETALLESPKKDIVEYAMATRGCYYREKANARRAYRFVLGFLILGIILGSVFGSVIGYCVAGTVEGRSTVYKIHHPDNP